MYKKDVFWCLGIVRMAGFCLSFTVTWHLIEIFFAVLKMKESCAFLIIKKNVFIPFNYALISTAV